MKLSKQLELDHESGDFGLSLEGYSERAKKLEDGLQEAINELQSWWDDQGNYGTYGYAELIPKLQALIDC